MSNSYTRWRQRGGGGATQRLHVGRRLQPPGFTGLALVLREVAAGHEVGITRHKKLVARLLPPAVPTAIELPDFVARARNVWHAGWSGTGTSELLEETRGSR